MMKNKKKRIILVLIISIVVIVSLILEKYMDRNVVHEKYINYVKVEKDSTEINSNEIP